MQKGIRVRVINQLNVNSYFIPFILHIKVNLSKNILLKKKLNFVLKSLPIVYRENIHFKVFTVTESKNKILVYPNGNRRCVELIGLTFNLAYRKSITRNHSATIDVS